MIIDVLFGFVGTILIVGLIGMFLIGLFVQEAYLRFTPQRAQTDAFERICLWVFRICLGVLVLGILAACLVIMGDIGQEIQKIFGKKRIRYLI